jgi:hypothetical protein
MQGIVGVVVVAALEAHKFLAQAACLNVSVAEISRTLRTFPPPFMGASSSRTFHGSHPLFTMKMQFIERLFSILTIGARPISSAGPVR